MSEANDTPAIKNEDRASLWMAHAFLLKGGMTKEASVLSKLLLDTLPAITRCAS